MLMHDFEPQPVSELEPQHMSEPEPQPVSQPEPENPPQEVVPEIFML